MAFNLGKLEGLERQLFQKNHAAFSGLPDSFVLPQYQGRSITNIPPTIGKLLGDNSVWSSPALDADMLTGLDDVERVIFLLIDGLGWQQLMRQLNGDDTGFADVLGQYQAQVTPITSVSPSTTSVATTTLLTSGATPAEHGLLGYTFLLAEKSLIANMLFWKPDRNPSAFAGDLEHWGIQPESFVPILSLAQVLAAAGIQMTTMMPQPIMHSPLSRMQMRGAKVQGYRNASDMWLKMSQWLTENRNERAYAFAYFSDFDSLSHRDGHDAPSWQALWHSFNDDLQRFLDTLPKVDNTLLILSADHGHVVTPLASRHSMQAHPDLLQHLMLMPGGEPRHRYLYARSGHKDAIRDYIGEHLSDFFVLLEAEEALEAGLYGSHEAMHPDAARRIGDFVLLAKGQNYLWNAEDNVVLLGMHGSLEAEEMLVPFITMRLGD